MKDFRLLSLSLSLSLSSLLAELEFLSCTITNAFSGAPFLLPPCPKGMNILKSMWNTFSVRLSRSTESTTDTISLALHSVSHALNRIRYSKASYVNVKVLHFTFIQVYTENVKNPVYIFSKHQLKYKKRTFQDKCSSFFMSFVTFDIFLARRERKYDT